MKINGNPDGGGGREPIVASLTVTSNGTYTPGFGVDAFDVVDVDVPSVEPVLESLSVTSNGTYTPGTGVDAFNEVSVNVPITIIGYTDKDMIQGLSESMIYDSETTSVRGHALYENKSVISIDLPNCTNIGTDAFNNCNISQVSLPECKNIGNGAFYDNEQLSTIFLPKCLNIGMSAFTSCKGIQAIDLPVCSYVNYNTFARCSNLSQVNLPVCSYVSTQGFIECVKLSQIDLPACTRIDNSAFNRCSKLESISLPNCSSIGGLVFESCSTLSEIDLPMCTFISGATFNNCSNLTTVKLPVLISTKLWYGNGVFLNCPNLSQLYIGSMYGIVVPYSSLFEKAENTKLQSGIGSIYVNVDNYNSYINATGWSSLSSLFVSVGDTLLSFSNGVVSGTTTVLYANPASLDYKSYLGISSSNITEVSLPECTYIDNSAFQGCTSLSQVSLPACTYIGMNTFMNCTSLSMLKIGDTGVVATLANSSALANTAIAAGNGSIYVPTSLVTAYQGASNWIFYSGQIVGY